jgi:hypothetical protein
MCLVVRTKILRNLVSLFLSETLIPLIFLRLSAASADPVDMPLFAI